MNEENRASNEEITEFITEYVKENDKTYRALRFILYPVVKLLVNPKIIGKENIPKDGPCIIASNHRCMWDPGMIAFSTKRTLHFLAKDSLFKFPIGWIFRLAQCIPVNRKVHNHLASSAALEVLRKEQVVAIFPEGTRNRTSEPLLPLKYGVVSLASKTKANIVPCIILGRYFPFFSTVRVIFGKPYKVESNIDLETANAELKQKLLELQEEIK